jgi:hypothetical protein
MNGMSRRIGGAQASATRPLSALISAALLLLAVVAGVSGVAGFAGPGVTAGPGPSAGPAVATTVVAASTTSIPIATERRSVTVLGTAAKSRQEAAGWAPQHPHHPQPADVALVPVVKPLRFVQAPVRAGPSVVTLTILVSHRGRAPPAGTLLT